MVEGTVLDNPSTDYWFVPFKYYRLIRVEMFKNEKNVSGFKVIYKRPETDYFTGYPLYMNHTFGTEDQDSEYEWVDLEKDLESISVCVD